MTGPADEQPEQPDQPLDPREEEVRRRLADARHVEPLPVDVASRLDAVLARLAEDGDVPSTVAELATRRRRRAAGLLAAAAAVTVVGLGLGQVLPFSSGADDSGDSASSAVADSRAENTAESDGLEDSAAGGAAGSAESGDPQLDEGEGKDGADDGAAAMLASPETAAGSSAVAAAPGGRPVRLRSERFAADALRARDLVDRPRSDSRGGTQGTQGGQGQGKKGRNGSGDTFFECTPADWGAGVAVPVLYDGEPHVLVFRAPAGDSQVADLLQCGTGEILRSTTLPAG